VYVLGIETSCDETSVAVLRDGSPVAGMTYSQLDHGAYGGVVPELASRAHLQKLDRLTEHVVRESGLGSVRDIDLVAVTDSPGLAGALLVGVSFALGLEQGHGVAACGVHHLEGHICAALIEHPDLHVPLLALVVSGGHTALYRVDDIGRYTCVGRTLDDAAGEAFDKVGKLLGLGYPAGPEIDREAAACGTAGGLSFPVARPGSSPFDFSFSGLKTAVKYFLEAQGKSFLPGGRPAVCRAFEESVVESLVRTTAAAAAHTGLNTLVCTGGVASNSMLRAALQRTFGDRIVFPSPVYCTDNAAMIARAGFERARRGLVRPPRMSPSRELQEG